MKRSPWSSSLLQRGMVSLLRLLAVLVVVLAGLTMSAFPVHAQWRIGAFVGGEHESSWDEFLVLGADARGAMGAGRFELNPRLSYFLREGVTRLQVDLNLVKPLRLANPGRIEPFLGIGAALQTIAFDNPNADGETSVGFNYIVGGTLVTTGSVRPFAQFTYTVLNEWTNAAVVSVGLHFLMGGRTSGLRVVPRR